MGKITHVHGIAVIDDDSHFTQWIKESGRLDHDQWLLSQILLYLKPGDVAIDVGAYIGDHTIAYARAVQSSGKVYAFEPFKMAFDCLKYNMRSMPHVNCFHAALSDKVENVATSVDHKNYGMNAITGAGDIPAFPLDSLNLPRLNFMKIDVEGYELNVLHGAKETIMRCRPVMLIEMNRATLERNGIKYSDIFTTLQEYGYFCINIDGSRNLEAEQYDLLCTP